MSNPADEKISGPRDQAQQQQSRWGTFTEGIAFHVERYLARGALARILVLWAFLVLLSFVGGVLAWLTPALEFHNMGEAAWWALLRISDPGYLVDDDAPGVRLLSIILTALGLALYVGVLIAIITQSFMTRMERIALGLRPVPFSRHVAVLGWTNRTLELVHELLVYRDGPSNVVVLVEEITPEIDQALRDRLPGRLRKRVLLRTGAPERLEDLHRIRGDRAAAVVLPGTGELAGHSRRGDPRVLKVVASLDRTAERVGSRPRIVAEIVNSDLISIAHSAYPGPLEMIPSDVVVGRSMALGSLAPGFSLVLGDLVDSRFGCAIRVEPLPSLAGETIAGASSRLPTAVLLGLLHDGPGGVELNAASDTRIGEDDRLLLIAPADSPLVVANTPLAESGPPLDAGLFTVAPAPRRVLVIGWSMKVRQLCRELARLQTQDLEIDVISRTPVEQRESLLSRELNDATVRHILGDGISPRLLAELDLQAYDSIILIGSENCEDLAEADSRTITTALTLSTLLDGAATKPHRIAEILNASNREVLENRDIELVVTPELMAQVLAGSVVQPALTGIYEQMVRGKLGHLGVVSLEGLAARGETTFGAMEAALRAQGHICLGIQREAAGHQPELAPDKRKPLRLSPKDRAVVVTPRSADSIQDAD